MTYSPAISTQAPDLLPDAAPPPALSPGDKLLIDVRELSNWTSLGIRTLRRLDADGNIPGRLMSGRRVLFQTEVIREWVRAGMPDRDQWAALQRRSAKR